MCLTAPTFQIAPVGPYKSLRNTSQLDCVCVNEHEEGRRPRWPLRSTRSRTVRTFSVKPQTLEPGSTLWVLATIEGLHINGCF